MQEWKWYVYILECADGSYYTGLTQDAAIRYDQHLLGRGGRYTAIHGVRKVVYIEEHTDFEEARNRERQIKDWSRAKKQKLISGEWLKEWSKVS